MAATIRASTAATATNSPTSPASTAVGDLVLVVHWTRGGAGEPVHTLQSGNGFFEIRSHAHNDGSTDGRLSLAYKVATAAGSNAYNAYTSNTGTDFAGIVVLQVGTWEHTLVGDTNNSASLTTNGLPNPPSITTPQTQCLVLVIGAWHLGSAATVAVTAPTNYTEVWEMAGSNTVELSVAQRTIATATTEDPGTFTDDVAPNGSCCITVAFRPRAVVLTAATVAFTETGNAAGLTRQLKLTADPASFAHTGVAAGLAKGISMVAASGAFALTGNDATLTYTPAEDPVLTADAGSYALTGTDTGLRVGRRLEAAAGTFAETGEAAGLTRQLRLSSTAGTFALTGNAAGLARGRSMTADVSSFALAGTAAALRLGRVLAAAVASFVESGQPAGLLVGKRITAASGAFVETGADVQFQRGVGFAAAVGAFTLSGISAAFARTYRLSAGVGALAYTGNPATLTGPSADKTLSAGPGAFTFSGANAMCTVGVVDTNTYLVVEPVELPYCCVSALSTFGGVSVVTLTPDDP